MNQFFRSMKATHLTGTSVTSNVLTRAPVSWFQMKQFPVYSPASSQLVEGSEWRQAALTRDDLARSLRCWTQHQEYQLSGACLRALAIWLGWVGPSCSLTLTSSSMVADMLLRCVHHTTLICCCFGRVSRCAQVDLRESRAWFRAGQLLKMMGDLTQNKLRYC